MNWYGPKIIKVIADSKNFVFKSKNRKMVHTIKVKKILLENFLCDI
jgi:hypothetical protein